MLEPSAGTESSGGELEQGSAPLPGGVCILGMHRSGTSLTAGVLHHLGVFLGGDHELQRADGANPSGYWELPDLSSLNDELLETFGATDDWVRVLPSDWEDSAGLEPLREKGRALLAERFASEPKWGWKDPRNSITIPFWEVLLAEPRYVVCIRNPVDVAQSLRALGDQELGLELHMSNWLRYTALAIENTSGRPRMVVDYDDFFADPEATVQRLARFVDLEERAADRGVREALDRFVDPALALFRTPAEIALEDERASREALALYRELRRLHARGSSEDLEPELLAREWQAVERLARRLRQREEAVAGNGAPVGASGLAGEGGEDGAQLAELETLVRHAESELSARTTALAQAEAGLRARGEALEQSERRVAALREQLAGQESRIAQHEADRSSAEGRIKELEARLEAAAGRAEALEAELASERARADELLGEADGVRERAGRLELELEQHDQRLAELRSELEQSRAAAGTHERRVEEAEGLAERQQALLDERDGSIRGLEAKIAELQQLAATELERVADSDQRLVATQTELSELLGHVERLKAAVEERDARLATLKEFLQEQSEDYHLRDAQQQQIILAMRRSRSWRITRPYRRTAILFRGITGRGDPNLKP